MSDPYEMPTSWVRRTLGNALMVAVAVLLGSVAAIAIITSNAGPRVVQDQPVRGVAELSTDAPSVNLTPDDPGYMRSSPTSEQPGTVRAADTEPTTTTTRPAPPEPIAPVEPEPVATKPQVTPTLYPTATPTPTGPTSPSALPPDIIPIVIDFYGAKCAQSEARRIDGRLTCPQSVQP